jgi:hypothetical protein
MCRRGARSSGQWGMLVMKSQEYGDCMRSIE